MTLRFVLGMSQNVQENEAGLGSNMCIMFLITLYIHVDVT